MLVSYERGIDERSGRERALKVRSMRDDEDDYAEAA